MARTNDWYLNKDRGKYTGLIFIELKKAFDYSKSRYPTKEARKIRNKRTRA